MPTANLPLSVALAATLAVPLPAADWPMWGGDGDRNMVSGESGIPRTWDVKDKTNIKWVAEIGSQSYGNPVVAEGKVYLGTNNELLRDPEQDGDRGVVMVFNEADGRVPVADHASEARGRPGERLAGAGRLLFARGQGRHGLLRFQPGGGLGARRRRLHGRRERRPLQRRGTCLQDRRRHHLEPQHVRRPGRVPAQHGGDVAFDRGRHAVRQYVERRGRKSREHPLASGAQLPGDRPSDR